MGEGRPPNLSTPSRCTWLLRHSLLSSFTLPGGRPPLLPSPTAAAALSSSATSHGLVSLLQRSRPPFPAASIAPPPPPPCRPCSPHLRRPSLDAVLGARAPYAGHHPSHGRSSDRPLLTLALGVAPSSAFSPRTGSPSAASSSPSRPLQTSSVAGEQQPQQLRAPPACGFVKPSRQQQPRCLHVVRSTPICAAPARRRPPARC